MKFITSEEELIFNSKITSLYFYSLWFPFHKKMITMISKLENKYNDIEIFAIDVNKFKNFCIRFNVKSVPTVIIYKDKIECHRVLGIPMTSEFMTTYNNIILEKNEKRTR